MGKRTILRVVLMLALTVVICFGLLIWRIAYLNKSADRNARAFCAAIPLGSDIAAIAATASAQKILWGPGQPYNFYFFHAFAFDKSVCEVFVTKDGKVVSTTVEVEID